jgi:hypothetical protein
VEPKYISDRVSVSEKNNTLSIVVSPLFDEKKHKVLTTWLILWSVCGIVILSQLFLDYTREEKLYLLVWLMFWTYFEYLTGYTYFWRKSGHEKLLIKPGQLYYKKDIRGGGKARFFETENIEIEKIDFNESSFWQSIGASYWMPGKETLTIKSGNKKLNFALDLDEKQSIKLMEALRKGIKRIRT